MAPNTSPPDNTRLPFQPPRLSAIKVPTPSSVRAPPPPFEECKRRFHMPIALAAADLGVTPKAVSKVIRANGYEKWPFKSSARNGTAKTLTLDDCKRRFHLPIDLAAASLGVCRKAVRKVMRENGYTTWPRCEAPPPPAPPPPPPPPPPPQPPTTSATQASQSTTPAPVPAAASAASVPAITSGSETPAPTIQTLPVSLPPPPTTIPITKVTSKSGPPPPMEEVVKRFHMPLALAAADLGCPQNAITRVIRANGYAKWPFKSSSRKGTSKTLTFEDCKARFHMPINLAAANLGVCRRAIRKVMRAHGYATWPRTGPPSKKKKTPTKKPVEQPVPEPEPEPGPEHQLEPVHGPEPVEQVPALQHHGEHIPFAPPRLRGFPAMNTVPDQATAIAFQQPPVSRMRFYPTYSFFSPAFPGSGSMPAEAARRQL